MKRAMTIGSSRRACCFGHELRLAAVYGTVQAALITPAIGDKNAILVISRRFRCVAPKFLPLRISLLTASAADLKFLHQSRQTHSGISNRKAALESYAC